MQLKLSAIAGAVLFLLSNAYGQGYDPALGSLVPLPPATPAPVSKYDEAIFQNRIPSDQLAFMNGFAGKSSGEAFRDKQFRKLMRSVIPDCVFHYGWDMTLSEAIEKVLTGSPLPVRIRDRRYLMVAGRGPYLGGRGFIWIDLQEGLALSAFYFHPTNGEPTPTVTVFSRQVKEASLGMSQLPPEFAADLNQWSKESHIPPITTRYFITGLNKRILLEHDEEYCGPADDPGACQQMDADAADIDLNAAYYLDQVSYATNATAWMIVGADHTAWVTVRDNTCRVGPSPLGCRIRMTRERTRVILNRHPMPHRPHG